MKTRKLILSILPLLFSGLISSCESGSEIDSSFLSGGGGGTTITTPTSAVFYNIPVILTNLQATATPTDLQVMVTINSSANSSIYATNLKNVNWQDGNGNVLPSWLESGETNTSTASVYWINLGNNTIAASGGTFTLYQNIYSTSYNAMDGVTTGAEPAYTSSYGYYDSGSNVFTQYGGGGTGWSNFTPVNSTWDTTNGYYEQTASGGPSYGGGPCSLIESTSYPADGSYILEMAFNYSAQSNARVGIIAVATPSAGDVFGYRFIGQQVSNGAGFLSFLNDQIAWVVNGTYGGSVDTNYTMQVQDNAGTWSGNMYAGYGVSGAALTSLASTPYTAANQPGATTGYVGISDTNFNGYNNYVTPLQVEWFRMRTLPPNAVAPSVSIQAKQLY